jgi:outer membrane protein assembly factor BamB
MKPISHKRKAVAALVVAAAICGCTRPSGIVWSFATPRPWVLAGDSQALTPAVDHNLAFFCGGYSEKQRSQLYAIDVSTGQSRWQYKAGDCASPPLICGDVVVTFAFAAESDRILVYGIDKDSGRQKWRIELPGNPHPPPPAPAGDFIFFAPGSRTILRIDARDGSVQTFDIDPDQTVAAENFWVVAAPGEAIFGYGKSFWRSQINADKPEEGPSLSEPAANPSAVASDGHVLLLGDEDGNLRAIDLGKGTVLWRDHWSKIASAPVLADGKIFLNIYEQKYAFIALALSSGQELWRIPEGSTYSPYWQSGRLYAAVGKAVMAVNGESGKVEWRFDAPEQVTTTPVPVENLVLFGTVKGALYAARPNSP